ncbi:hypothetical protein O3P69_005771 [Scylla paramamosain]|uniref:Uncharacterized protein n=1 Tax=Scylla paramamosain TaxID=85552 RepID=A0AAW0U712_SCYPA
MKIAVVACLLAAGVIAASEGGGEVVNREERASEDRLEQDRRGVRLFALSTTTSIKRLATTTITAINTCLSVIAGTTCTGRRKRALFSDLNTITRLPLYFSLLTLSDHSRTATPSQVKVKSRSRH